MEILEVKSGVRKAVVVRLAEEKDFRKLTKRRYFFRWKALKGVAEIYTLHIEEEEDIQGVIGLVDVPEEERIEIRLLANARENQGRNKIYDRVAGCLIAFACDLAVDKYKRDACVSLVPKTKLVGYYMRKYCMVPKGRQLCLENEALNYIIDKYFYVQ
jgi:hypothetical protein